jgi:DNA-binding CsgD family transcriptional regulator
VIGSLIDASLLRRDPSSDGDGLFTMLQTIQEYGLEMLSAAGDEVAARDAHAAYFAELAEMAAPEVFRGQYPTWLRRLAREVDNLRAALTWLAKSRQEEALLRLAGALWPFWWFHGPYAEGRFWLERARAGVHQAAAGAGASTTATNPLRARALIGEGLMAVLQGDAGLAEVRLSEALAIYQAAGDRVGAIIALRAVGMLATHAEEYERAVVLHERTLEEAEQLTNPTERKVYIGGSLGYLGGIALATGELDDAAERFTSALEVMDAVDYRWGAAFARICLGYVAVARGDGAQALAALRVGLGYFQETGLTLVHEAGGDARMVAVALAGFAALAASWSHPVLAARLFGAAAAIEETTRLPRDPSFRAVREQGTSAARSALGDHAFSAALAAGADLSVEQAVAEAMALTAPTEMTGPDMATDRLANRYGLTPREVEVLRLLARRLTDREIADMLFLSQHTVGRHVQNILGKLNVGNRREAAALAETEGLI